MKPNDKLITIRNNLELITQLLNELVLLPRINAIKWSQITRQTPNIKIGYPGQHLASLITGMEGERTGARGNDLVDGSEVKSCSRIDQLDSCRNCNAAVSRLEDTCPNCNSTNINRKNDSKWLFGIRDENELNVLIHEVRRVVLVIADYPNFNENDYTTVRFQSFEIWPESSRNQIFPEIMSNYYYKIFLEHKKLNPNKTPAPKNFWPYQYQFYMCNPIPIFISMVRNANSTPEIEIHHYIEPHIDRSDLPSVTMPLEVLTDNELRSIIENCSEDELTHCIKPEFAKDFSLSKTKLPDLSYVRHALLGIDENLRKYLSLRDTDRIAVAGTPYSRRRVQT